MPLFGGVLVHNRSSKDHFAEHSYYLSGIQEQKKRKIEVMKNKKAHKKQKKHHASSSESEKEPAALKGGLVASRTKVPKEELPSLYKQDLGTVGIKKKTNSPVLSGPHVSFKVRLTADEQRRRKQRQLRFSASTSFDESLPDSLSSALSAPREKIASSKNGNGKRKAGAMSAMASKGLVGTCQNLEKPYLRLTTFPKAEDVRPMEVLTMSLQHIKCRYIKTEDFEWANEQLKSVRQDVTVQGLKNDFVLDVYETHARILLEHGDLNEFNQCQTMIRTLTTGITGAGSDNGTNSDIEEAEVALEDAADEESVILSQSAECADEFGGYRLLYALVQNSSDVTKELANATRIINQEDHRASRDEQREPHTASCRHAILVTKAVTHNDYHAFFRLYETAPHLSAYLMDFLVKRVRKGAYQRIIAAYRPTISVEHFREALCLADLEETRRFLRQSGAVFVPEEKGEPPFWVDCKTSK